MKINPFIIILAAIHFMSCSSIIFSQRELNRAMSQKEYRFVTTLDDLPPRLKASFYSFTGIKKMAKSNEQVNINDVVIDSLLNCRFLLAGISSEYSFIAYAIYGGGRAINIVAFRNYNYHYDSSPIPVWSGYCEGYSLDGESTDSTFVGLKLLCNKKMFIEDWSN